MLLTPVGIVCCGPTESFSEGQRYLGGTMNAGQAAALVKIMLAFVVKTDSSSGRECRAYNMYISRLSITKGAGIHCLIWSLIHRIRQPLDH